VTRALEWAGCVNVRDLGGVPVAGGGETRRGVLFRADNVRKLTDEGRRSLAEHGVTRIVDLRWPEEIDRDPPGDVDIDVVHVSVLGEYDPSVDDGIADFLPDDVAGYRVHLYTGWLERYRPQFAQAVAALADSDGPAVFHCTGGKDRTGLVAAILLRLAGAEPAEIAADYALSERAFLRGGEEGERLFVLATPPAGMERTLEHVDRTYGGVAEYLRGAGVTDEQLARLEERLAPARA
jgi:protein tyrosine/serine phosphatase